MTALETNILRVSPVLTKPGPSNVNDKQQMNLIHDVNPSQLSGAFHRSPLREALLNARRNTVLTHRATTNEHLILCAGLFLSLKQLNNFKFIVY